jgi:hypothetical protein
MTGGASAKAGRRSVHWRLALVVSALVAGHGAGAQEASLAASAADAAPLPPRLEVASTSLPRFDGVDSIGSTQRVDLTLLPPRRSAVGLAVGMSGFAAPATVTGAGLTAATPPSVDVGLHWRHTFDSNYRIDVTAWRRMAMQPQDAWSLIHLREPTYGARVELNLTPQQRKGFVAERGFVGMQLDNGGRISIRRKNGGPMIYYRTKF